MLLRVGDRETVYVRVTQQRISRLEFEFLSVCQDTCVSILQKIGDRVPFSPSILFRTALGVLVVFTRKRDTNGLAFVACTGSDEWICSPEGLVRYRSFVQLVERFGGT